MHVHPLSQSSTFASRSVCPIPHSLFLPVALPRRAELGSNTVAASPDPPADLATTSHRRGFDGSERCDSNPMVVVAGEGQRWCGGEPGEKEEERGKEEGEREAQISKQNRGGG